MLLETHKSSWSDAGIGTSGLLGVLTSAFEGLEDQFKELRVCGSSDCKKAHKIQGTKMHPSVYFP